MASYVVRHAYRSRRDEQTFGPWVAGDVVELDEQTAGWLELDSPGLLAAAAQREPVERQAPKPRDRQQRGGRNRGA